MGLENIFDYYARVAIQRKNKEAAAKLKGSTLAADVYSMDPVAVNSASAEKRQKKKKKQTEDFKEGRVDFKDYNQFIVDFNLKSSSFLSALQLGDIYLNVVQLKSDDLTLSGMTIENFYEILLRIAVFAYRNLEEEYSLQNKIKALFVHMWKAVNTDDKLRKGIVSRGNVGTGVHSGSLNIFGSGLFVESFLKFWQGEGFSDYILPESAVKEEGIQVLAKVTQGVLGMKINSAQDSIKNEENVRSDEDQKHPIGESITAVNSGPAVASFASPSPGNRSAPPPPRGAPPPRGGAPPPPPTGKQNNTKSPPPPPPSGNQKNNKSPPPPPTNEPNRRQSIEDKIAAAAAFTPPPPLRGGSTKQQTVVIPGTVNVTGSVEGQSN